MSCPVRRLSPKALPSTARTRTAPRSPPRPGSAEIRPRLITGRRRHSARFIRASRFSWRPRPDLGLLVDIKKLRVGMQCTTADGSLVEVRDLLPDNIHLRVKYLDTMDNPELEP